MTSAGTNRYPPTLDTLSSASSASARALSFVSVSSSLRRRPFSVSRASICAAWSRMSDHQLPAPVIGENTVAAARSSPPSTLDATVRTLAERPLAAAQVEDDEGQRCDDENRKQDAGAARQHGDSLSRTASGDEADASRALRSSGEAPR